MELTNKGQYTNFDDLAEGLPFICDNINIQSSVAADWAQYNLDVSKRVFARNNNRLIATDGNLIVSYGNGEVFRFLNVRYVEILGISYQEIKGDHWGDVPHNHDYTEVQS